MPHEKTYYALDLLKNAGEKAAEAVSEMSAMRKKLDKYMETDRKRAKNIHTALKKQKETLLKTLSELPLPLMESGMDSLSTYTQKLIASIRAFQIMTPDYSKLERAVNKLVEQLPQNNNAVNAAVIGRLMNRVKMGYYPTDLEHLAHIKRGIAFPENAAANLFDPCCGKGLALAALGEGTNCATYGVELDNGRADEALCCLTRVGFGSFFHSRISKNVFHAMLLNPPYLSVLSECGGRYRSERRFLVESIPHLMMDGLLIYIIPYYRLTKDVCKVLCDNFQDITVWKFYGEEFARFSQIAVMGIRKERGQCCEGEEELGRTVYDIGSVPELSGLPDGRYALPEEEKTVNVFKGAEFNEAELAAQLASSKSFTQLFEKNKIDETERRPLLPLSIGQIGLIGGSGLINGLIAGDAPHIIKGRVVKETRVRQETSLNSMGECVNEVHETRTNKMVFNILTPDGFRSLS